MAKYVWLASVIQADVPFRKMTARGMACAGLPMSLVIRYERARRELSPGGLKRKLRSQIN